MGKAVTRPETCYVFALLTTTDDPESLHRSVTNVLTMMDHSDRKDMEFGITSFDYSSPAHVGIMRKFVPFYAAPGYEAPSAGE